MAMTYRSIAARLTAALIAASLAGCMPKSYVVLLPNADGTTGRIVVSGTAGQTEIGEAGLAASLDRAKPEPFRLSQAEFDKTFAAALDAQPALPAVFRLYFELGGTRLTPESEALLAEVRAEVARREGADMSIIGHTDTAGDARANQALGLERAQFVRERIAASGLKLERVSIESHGEGNLLVPTPDETPEPRNRRVEIVVR